MSTTPFPLDAAAASLRGEEGLYVLDEPRIGDRILELERRGFPYFTHFGLEFCQQFALDERIRSILEAVLGSCKLGHWLRYEQFPGHIECFRRGQKAGQRLLLLHLWAKKSQVDDYYPGSHLHDLKVCKGRRSLFEIAPEEMERVGLAPEPRSFEEGRMVIADACLAFQIRQGYAITSLFGTEDVVANWAKITLPLSEDLQQLVYRMQADVPDIGLKFDFKQPENEKA